MGRRARLRRRQGHLQLRAGRPGGRREAALAKSILRVFGGEEPTATGAPDDVHIRDAWPYGGVYVVEALWRELGIDTVLRDHAATEATAKNFERALFLMVAKPVALTVLEAVLLGAVAA